VLQRWRQMPTSFAANLQLSLPPRRPPRQPHRYRRREKQATSAFLGICIGGSSSSSSNRSAYKDRGANNAPQIVAASSDMRLSLTRQLIALWKFLIMPSPFFSLQVARTTAASSRSLRRGKRSRPTVPQEAGLSSPNVAAQRSITYRRVSHPI